MKLDWKFLRVFQPFRPSDQLPSVPRGGGDSSARNVDNSRPDVPLGHGEKEVVFPTPIGSSGHAGEGPVDDEVMQGDDVSDSLDLRAQSPAVGQNRGAVSTGEGTVDHSPATPASDVTRRSVRAGRGTTTKYDDFVRD